MKTSAKVSMRLKILAFIFFILCTVTSVHGREFFCPGADATCLITAINEANNNGEENTIFLESGEYVTEPISIMGPFPLTIIGQGGGNYDYPSPPRHSTWIRRAEGGFCRLSRKLTLTGLTITGGFPVFPPFVGAPIPCIEGGGIENAGTLNVINGTVTSNRTCLAIGAGFNSNPTKNDGLKT